MDKWVNLWMNLYLTLRSAACMAVRGRLGPPPVSYGLQEAESPSRASRG